MTNQLVDEFIEAICRFSRVFPPVGKHFNYPRDPDDEPYLNLAIEAHANYLASRDNDILDLRSGTEPAAIEFRQRFPTLRILEPLEFLRELRQELQHSQHPIRPNPRESEGEG